MLLEQRRASDVLRNALVCVMLRLIEYYPGILFLTTNRIESLDPAFASRVQCALRYDALDLRSCAQIWRDCLSRAPLAVQSGLDMQALARFELNGRQIKNAIQMATALARSEEAQLTQAHLDAALTLVAY